MGMGGVDGAGGGGAGGSAPATPKKMESPVVKDEFVETMQVLYGALGAVFFFQHTSIARMNARSRLLRMYEFVLTVH